MKNMIHLCVCGTSIALILLFLIVIGVWTMPYRMKKVTENNKLGI